jgi:hypothetical protein
MLLSVAAQSHCGFWSGIMFPTEKRVGCDDILFKVALSLLKRMAGTTRLELATSAVTDGNSPTGANGISRLRARLTGPTGYIGSCWDILCNGLCNDILPSNIVSSPILASRHLRRGVHPGERQWA